MPPEYTIDKETLLAKCLIKGIKKLRKASEIQCQGLALIEKVACKSPNLSTLVNVFSPICSAYVKPKIETGKNSEKPEHISYDEGKGINYPKKIDFVENDQPKCRFICQHCPFVARSWGGTDAHIRKCHTHLQYGPCSNCDFVTFNVDSFRTHTKTCLQNR